MRTTFTFMRTLPNASGRIATSADFLALGEGNHKSPGWIHLVVDWPKGKPEEGVVDVADGAGHPYQNLSAYECELVIKHCRAYESLMARLFPDFVS